MANLSIASVMAFNLAAEEARALGSVYIDVDHLLLGLCKVEDVLALERDAVPNISETDWQNACAEIQEFTDRLQKAGLDCKRTRRHFRGILLNGGAFEKGAFSGHRTPRGRETFEKAEKLCKETAASYIGLAHLCHAALQQGSQEMEILFSQLMMDREGILEALFPLVHPTTEEHPAIEGGGETTPRKKTATPYLDKFGKDYTKLAREGKLETAIGRHAEIRRVAQILVQKKKNNPILVGDAGVGKTCIVEGLAQHIVRPDAPESIRNLKIIELGMGSLVAGTKYRGDFEERLDMLLKEAASDPNIVLFFDEVHLMVGAGASGEGGMDAANILKPALARGEIKCIGATTTSEYHRYIEKDAALERRFQIVWVDEPTAQEAVLILKGIRPKYEEYYGIVIPDHVIEAAVSLSIRYLPDFRLPDKAIDIIDQACSTILLKTMSGGTAADGGDRELKTGDVASVISVRCRVPVEELTVEESERFLHMEDFLRQRVIGQDHAVEIVSETVRRAKAGLKDPNKPVGVFLFLGSTGIGKTELAKALAEFLFHDENKLVTIDMSEFQEKHSVSKLLGAPPGYVGFEQEGVLSQKIRTNPYSVVVFDEAEKAHPSVFDIFLQIFDEGRLTDSHGRRVNFSEAIIILTSNLGAGNGVARKQRPIGFQNEGAEETDRDAGETSNKDAERTQYEARILGAVNAALRPEILNRIDKKIVFQPLGREAVRSIIVKIEGKLNQRLAGQGIRISLQDSAYDFLMKKGYSAAFGAREMQRAFETYITEPLSKQILEGAIRHGDRVVVDASGDRLTMEAER